MEPPSFTAFEIGWFENETTLFGKLSEVILARTHVDRRMKLQGVLPGYCFLGACLLERQALIAGAYSSKRVTFGSAIRA